MGFVSLLPHNSSSEEHERVKSKPNHTATTPKVSVRPSKRGCEYCPLNKVHGIHKIFSKVQGRKIFIWAQSPGFNENKERKELVGRAGEWLWNELRKVGIKRKHCDIQNVVRCFPADRLEQSWPPFKMRSPSKEEIKCCSIYNEEAIEKSKARLHLVFGKIAAASLLKKEFKPDKRIFFSDMLKGWVVYLDHPAYFIRQGYTPDDNRPASESLQRFRSDLAKAKQFLKSDNYDRFAFLKKQKYIGIVTTKQARRVYKKLKREARKHRLVIDVEEGKINERTRKPDDNGKSVALCCGIAARAGITYTFALDHPSAPASRRCRIFNREIIQKLVQNENAKKSAHYLPYDRDATQRLLGASPKGFDYDTQTAEYFRDPDAKAYGLAKIAERRYPNFLDYKSIEGPDAFTHDFKKLLKEKKFAKLPLPQQVQLARDRHGLNLARLPWNKMVLYNGADCHLEKLVEQDTIAYVHQPLMQIYVDSSYVLYRMQRDKECLPVFDYKWHKKLTKLWPLKVKLLERKLRKAAGKYAYIRKNDKVTKKRFNPGSNEHILWLLYDKLKYKYEGEGKANTREGTLLRLAQKHSLAGVVVLYRKATKATSTYIGAYKKCADLNEGYLRTIWKQTGTGTGRFSSGRSKDAKNVSVINFQNIHGDPLIKCLLISDRRWYKMYKYWLKHGDFNKKTWKKFSRIKVDIGFDFSQNELRQLAEESGDEELIRIFSSTKKWYCDPKKKGCGKWHLPDPHVDVGHALTGWARGIIAHNDHFRKLVKNMQFGLVFGLQGPGLYRFLVARGVKTKLKEVNKYHARYFKRFDGVRTLQNRYRNFAEKHSYVVNMFGFRRNLKVNEQKQQEEARQNFDGQTEERSGAFWQNQAINTPIQGASHQYLVMSLAVLHRKPKEYNLVNNPNKEIHDALYFSQMLKYLFRAVKQGKKLLVEEPVNVVKNDFGLRKKVPLSAKSKAGFRFGVQVEGIGEEDGINTEWEFLNSWCRENQKLEKSYKRQLSVLE